MQSRWIRSGIRTLKIFLAAAVMLSAGAPIWASDDIQYWSRLTLKGWQNEKLALSTYLDMRLVDDVERSGLYLVSEQLAYRWLDNLDLGLNYTYLESEVKSASGAKHFQPQHRLELEANPYWSAADFLKVKNRNRLEFRWIENQGSDNTRFRHRWELEFPLKEKAPLRAVFVNNEFFYDFNKGEYSENRAIPFGVKLALNNRISLQVFYMIQSRKGSADWSSNQVIGTHVFISF